MSAATLTFVALILAGGVIAAALIVVGKFEPGQMRRMALGTRFGNLTAEGDAKINTEGEAVRMATQALAMAQKAHDEVAALRAELETERFARHEVESELRRQLTAERERALTLEAQLVQAATASAARIHELEQALAAAHARIEALEAELRSARI